MRELEVEFDAEQRRSRDATAAKAKLEQALNELRARADEDHRVRAELEEQVSALNSKIRIQQKQLEEAVRFYNNNAILVMQAVLKDWHMPFLVIIACY